MDNQLLDVIRQMQQQQQTPPKSYDNPDRLPAENRALAILGMLSGDKTLAPFGQTMLERDDKQGFAQQRQDELGYQHGQDAIGNNLALARLSQTDEDQRLNRADRRDALAQRLSEQRERDAERKQMAQDRAEAKDADTRDRNVQKLAVGLDKQGYSELQQSTRDVLGMLNKYEGKGIPGIGGVQNIDAMGIGGASTYLPFGGGEEARQNQSIAASLKNSILKARSGGAVTEGEAARMMTELQQSWASGDKEYRKAARRVANTINARVANYFAGFTPDVVDEYQRHGGSVQPPRAVGGRGASGTWSSDYLNNNPNNLSQEEWLNATTPGDQTTRKPERWTIGADGRPQRE